MAEPLPALAWLPSHVSSRNLGAPVNPHASGVPRETLPLTTMTSKTAIQEPMLGERDAIAQRGGRP